MYLMFYILNKDYKIGSILKSDSIIDCNFIHVKENSYRIS